MNESDRAGVPAFEAHGRPIEAPALQPPHPHRPAAAPPREKTRNAAATAAFVLGWITLALGLFWIMAEPFLAPSTDRTEDVGSAVAVRAAAAALIECASLATITLGLFSLRRPGKRARAGIAIGIAVFAILSALLGLAASFLR